jgi:hypothetical protein
LAGADCASVNNESVDDCDIVFSSFAITSRSRMFFSRKRMEIRWKQRIAEVCRGRESRPGIGVGVFGVEPNADWV